MFFYQKLQDEPEEEPLILTPKEEVKETSEQELPEEMYIIDVKGEVNDPGIYQLPTTSRVIDAINEAGGLTVNADTSVLNLSKKIIDEMVIIVYSQTEVENFQKTKELETELQNNCLQPDENSLKNDACISTEDISSSTKISINTATLEQLMTLPGIGEAKAQEIINYRTNNGNFTTIEDILNVPGIGESLFAQIKENITI